jgi:hypothetical protein
MIGIPYDTQWTKKKANRSKTIFRWFRK